MNKFSEKSDTYLAKIIRETGRKILTQPVESTGMAGMGACFSTI